MAELFFDKTLRTCRAERHYFIDGDARTLRVVSRSLGRADRKIIFPVGLSEIESQSLFLAQGVGEDFVLDKGGALGEPDIMVLRNDQNKKIYAKKFEIILGFSSADPVTRAGVQLDYGLLSKWFDSRGNFGAFKFNGLEYSALVDKLKSDVRVIFAEPNIIDGSDDLDDDDAEADDYFVNLPNSLWSHELIGLEGVRRAGDGMGVVVAVVDYPITFMHPALSGTFLSVSDSLTFDKNIPSDKTHGTEVASVIVGQTRTGSGFPLGISPRVKILPIALNMSASSDYAKRAMAINFLAEIAQKKLFFDPLTGTKYPVERLIVNCSWKLDTGEDLTAMALAFKRLSTAGALCVCSAGNLDSDKPHYPSDYPECLSVAGITRNLEKSTNSNYGQAVDLCAPGGDGPPWTEDADILVASLDDKYRFFSGTSYASPLVAGALANAWSRNPNWLASELRSFALKSLVKKLPDGNLYAGKLGAGVLDLKELG